MEPNPGKNFWAIAGLPGAGKTTLCDKLVAGGNFELFSRDREMEAIRANYGDEAMCSFRKDIDNPFSPPGLLYKFEEKGHLQATVGYTVAPYRKAESETSNAWITKQLQVYVDRMKPFVPALRSLLNELMSFWESTGLLNVLHFTSELKRAHAQTEPVAFFLSMYHMHVLQYLTIGLAQKRTAEKAIAAYRSGVGHVLLDTHVFFTASERKFWANYIQQAIGGPAGLIIFRATRNELIQAARTRKPGALAREGSRPEEILKLADQVQPLSKQEAVTDWGGRVIAIDRATANDVGDVRLRIGSTLQGGGEALPEQILFVQE